MFRFALSPLTLLSKPPIQGTLTLGWGMARGIQNEVK